MGIRHSHDRIVWQRNLMAIRSLPRRGRFLAYQRDGTVSNSETLRGDPAGEAPRSRRDRTNAVATTSDGIARLVLLN